MNIKTFAYGGAFIVAGLAIAFILYCYLAPIGGPEDKQAFTAATSADEPSATNEDPESAAVYSDLKKRLKEVRDK